MSMSENANSSRNDLTAEEEELLIEILIRGEGNVFIYAIFIFYMPYLFFIFFLGPGPENTEVDQVSGPVKVAMVPAKKRGRRISSEQNASSSSLV